MEQLQSLKLARIATFLHSKPITIISTKKILEVILVGQTIRLNINNTLIFNTLIFLVGIYTYLLVVILK